MKKALLGISHRLFSRNTALLIICSLLACLFIYTGLNKLMDHEQVQAQLTRSPFIQPMAGFLAWAVPIAELIIATLLTIRPTKRNFTALPYALGRILYVIPSARLLGLYLSYGLMLLFTGYVYIMLNFAYDLPCSCGGIISKLSWRQHLYVNIGFTALALTGILIYPKYMTQPSSAAPPKIAFT